MIMMRTEKRVTESGETEAKVPEYERIYQQLVEQKYRAIRNQHERALEEDRRKVEAGFFRPLSPG